MSARLVLGLLFIGLLTFSGYMLYENGQINARADEYSQSLDEALAEALKQRELNQITQSMLAETRKANQLIERRARNLSDDLSKQKDDSCINQPISDVAAGWVLEFRAGKDGNDQRAGAGSVD